MSVVAEGPEVRATLARIRQLLGEGRAIAYAPDVPARAAERARRVHGLGDAEPILALHDQTLLGSGDEGFVITSERLCVRGFLEAPWSVAWEAIDPGRVRLEGLTLFLGDRAAHLEDRFVAERLFLLVREIVRAPASPYR